MKTKLSTTVLVFFLLLGFLWAPVKSAVVFNTITSAQFYSVASTNQSFDARLIEQGTGLSESLYELGVAPNGTSTTYMPVDTDQYAWEMKVKTPFSLVYTFAGNLTLSLNGSIPSVTYQPIGAISEILIGNRNQSGGYMMGLNLTNLTLDGQALPDILTNGSSSGGYVFSGLAIAGFNKDWTLTGEIEWDTGIFTDLLYNNSRAMFVGVQNPTGFVIPEPTSILLILCSSMMFLRRRR